MREAILIRKEYAAPMLRSPVLVRLGTGKSLQLVGIAEDGHLNGSTGTQALIVEAVTDESFAQLLLCLPHNI